jgi:hypothetical protein
VRALLGITWLKFSDFSNGFFNCELVIAECNYETAFFALGQVSLAIYNSFNMTSESGQTILDTSIVHQIFNKSYLI